VGERVGSKNPRVRIVWVVLLGSKSPRVRIVWVVSKSPRVRIVWVVLVLRIAPAINSTESNHFLLIVTAGIPLSDLAVFFGIIVTAGLTVYSEYVIIE
jgi:hypothetical protein